MGTHCSSKEGVHVPEGSAPTPHSHRHGDSRKSTSKSLKSFVSGKQERDAKLLDTYTLGKPIGQGAFGIVYWCKLKETGDKFAVKMIDPVETPLDDIKREVRMLSELAHECVVKMRDVFYERVFVCVVMDIYSGGDMIEGMQRCWNKGGQIPIAVIQRCSRMMIKAVAFLHEHHVVHRDLKADNFLQSVKDIDDPEIRVYLSDFGTVVKFPPSGRLHEKCGTQTYWAPEFYRQDYALAVDVWALGVILWGMVTSRFPFKGEADVKGKEVSAPARAGKDGQAFLTATLKKREAERITAQDAVRHKFLDDGSSSMPEPEADARARADSEQGGGEVKEQGPNAGVKQRRRELVKKLDQATKATKSLAVKWHHDFEVEDNHADTKTKFEWWSPQKVEQAGFLTQAGVRAEEQRDPLAEENIKRRLEEHGIDTTKWGTGEAKSLQEFTTEVLTGESRKMLDATQHKTIVRVIDVVLLRIVSNLCAGKQYLITLSETFPDKKRTREVNQLPGTKKRPHENGRMVVERVVKERLRGTSLKLSFDFELAEEMEESEESKNFPGMLTVYRKEIYEGVITTDDPAILKQFGLVVGGEGGGQFSAEGTDGYSRVFEWVSKDICLERGIKFRKPREDSEVTPLAPPPVGYDEEDLITFLEESRIDLSQFAQKGCGSLAALAEELQVGQAALTRQPDGKIMRVVDVIVLRIVRANGDILVQAWQEREGGARTRARLPGVKRRQDENLFWAAHRLITGSLRINQNFLQIDAEDVRLIEEVKAAEVWANLPTLYRRRIVKATLVED